MNIFEKASKKKLRFASNKGNIGVEDLWDLPLTSNSTTNLDNLAKMLNRDLKETEEESFVKKATTTNSVAQLKFDIVKHIIDVKLADADKASKSAETKATNEKIMDIISRKSDADLEGKSIEELKTLIVK